jgi:glycerol-3-phosphate dehydrogenase (NAD(P)+)
MSKVSVFGAGAWGSTLAQVLCDAGNEVVLWGRKEDVVNEINTKHTNVKYTGQNVLPSEIRATTNLEDAFAFSNTYVLAIPSQELRSTLQLWKQHFSDDCLIVSTLKGIEVSTQMRMTEVLEDVIGKHRVALIT